MMEAEVPRWRLVMLYRMLVVAAATILPLIVLGLLFPGGVETVMPYPRFVILAAAYSMVLVLLPREYRRLAREAGKADEDGKPWGWGQVIGVWILLIVGSGGILGVLLWPR
jgi:hypothetical protein